MIIDVVGDVHGQFKRFKYLFENTNPKPDVIIACGDFGYWPNHLFYTDLRTINFENTKVYFCDGNHEDHEALERIGINSEIVKNVFYVKRGDIITLGDKNFLFMGGANSIDKAYRTPGYDWFPEENISEKDMLNFEINIKKYNKIDYVISHTAPNEFNMVDAFKLKIAESNRDKLSYILNKVNPDYWFFGHWHKYQEGVYKNTKWTALSEIGDSYKNFRKRIIL